MNVFTVSFFGHRELHDVRVVDDTLKPILKKLMSEKKIPLALRPRIPVICDENGIVAVPWLGVSDACYVKDPKNTDTCFAIEIALL